MNLAYLKMMVDFFEAGIEGLLFDRMTPALRMLEQKSMVEKNPTCMRYRITNKGIGVLTCFEVALRASREDAARMKKDAMPVERN